MWQPLSTPSPKVGLCYSPDSGSPLGRAPDLSSPSVLPWSNSTGCEALCSGVGVQSEEARARPTGYGLGSSCAVTHSQQCANMPR